MPCNGCKDLYVAASFLLWQAKMWGLEFGAKSFLPNVPGSTTQTFHEKLYVPDFAWKPGFRLSVGGYLPHDAWDIRASWTIYRDECTSLKKRFQQVLVPPGIGVMPLWQYPFLQISGDNTGNPIRYSNAFGNWKMHLDSIDLELGRSFFPEQSIPMRLLMGAKLTFMRQKYVAEYDGGTTILATLPQGGAPSLFQYVSSQFQLRSHQWGIGPRLGIESRWNMLWGFNLIGNGACSVLCSFFDLHSKFEDIIQPTGQCTMSRSEKFHELTPILEAMLGLDWGTCFCNGLYFGAQIGYEWQYWWAANHARRNYVQTLPGDTIDMRGELQMHGLNAKVLFEY
ncbi:MAG: hypothetical protein KGI83_06955 [Verrucomicrobiota bacterium]|nr:hypothetical protein [Verrucomicrobiota bacterium]